MRAREISVRVLTDVLRYQIHLDAALLNAIEPAIDKRERKLAQEICYGVMRWYHQLSWIADLLLNKPVKDKDADILSLILMGLYQLRFMRIPDHAAISATVETVHVLGKAWASDLVNAILRRYQRERDSMEKRINDSPSARYSHPEWMLERFQQQWPDYWRSIISTNNELPPLHVRVNTNKTTRKEYLEVLVADKIEYKKSRHCDSGLELVKPVPVEAIPGFSDGRISIQDFGAQLAAPLLDCRPGYRVLDACAAPGGKSTHILELTPDIEKLVSVDINTRRLKLLESSLGRLGLSSDLIVADLTKKPDWWDGRPFDRILLDAPCTATGVIRRHPDIKYNRAPEQLPEVETTQAALICNLWPLLKPGGKLLYCTCSLFKEESDEQIAKFLSQYDNAGQLPIQADWGVQSQFGRHTIPGVDEGDGFYYSIIVKKTSNDE